MPIDEPRWWYEAPHAIMPRLLAPVSWLFGRFAERRWRGAKPYRSRLAVICIGNFTAGGTGKTPLALAAASMLMELGEQPVFLSRGYGGSKRGPHRVDLARDRAADVGDEPLLLAESAPVFVSRDRAAGARAIEVEIAGKRLDATVIVMDDGLQNPALTKDLTLAVVDARRGFGNSRVMPAGPMRAPLDMQLRLADAIVVNGPAVPPPTSAVANMLQQRFSGSILHASVSAAGDTMWLRQRPLVAFAGIGNPRRFFDLVRTLNGQIAAEVVFADHQPLTERDATRILEAARLHGAGIVTTEKDLARLRSVRTIHTTSSNDVSFVGWVRRLRRNPTTSAMPKNVGLRGKEAANPTYAATGALAQLATEARPLPIKLYFSPQDRAQLAQLLRSALNRKP